VTPPIAWDTSLVSRLWPGTPALAYLEDEALAGRPLRIPAPVLTEISFGLARDAQRDARFAAQLEWIEDLLRHPKVEILAIGREAGFLAGRLRALAHHPPDRGRRDARTKPERRVSWLLDLQIAAAAWASGCDVATENNGDFEAIADLLAAKLGLEPLIVHRSPL